MATVSHELSEFMNFLDMPTYTPEAKHFHFGRFLDYYNILCREILMTKEYSDKQLSEHIFKNTVKDDLKELVFKKHLYASKKTLERLNSLIKKENFGKYEELLKLLLFDLYYIIKKAEKDYRNRNLNVRVWHSKAQPGFAIQYTAAKLFYAEEDIANIPTREQIPVSVFLVRQAIEVAGKQALGIGKIETQDGLRARNISPQVAWDFIRVEVFRGSQSRIILPINVDIIMEVEKWTNAYIHTGNIPKIYLIDNALQFIKLLFVQSDPIQLFQYQSLKIDFEIFINQRKKKNWVKRMRNVLLELLRIKKAPPKLTVQWMHPHANIKT